MGNKAAVVKLIKTERQSQVLTRAEFGCLRSAYTINVTRGCACDCVYCHFRVDDEFYSTTTFKYDK